ncbi:MAG: EAL domain-containing protein [Opitutaceae bacterium]|nr:EAL domain-containing protein [Opitutaceae bacterium]
MNSLTDVLFFKHSNLGMLKADHNMKITAINDAFSNITGYSSEDMIGRTPNILSSGRHDAAFYKRMWRSINCRGYWSGEVWNKRKNGEIYPELLTIDSIKNEEDETKGYIGIFADISSQEKDPIDLGYLAHHDPLTGLSNRLLLKTRFKKFLDLVKRNNAKTAVLFIDLDAFKPINDTLGHSAGDSILVEVAERLSSVVRKTDTITRWGGDEFVIVLDVINKNESPAIVAEKIIGALKKQPFIVDEKNLYLSCSIGISVYPNDADNGEALVRKADIAMYQAKSLGGSQYSFYKDEMTETIKNQHNMLGDLRNALEKNQLELYYQPQYSIKTGEMSSVEALIRWHHPENGMIPPDQFIPVAEAKGLIIPIGTWVLRTACQQALKWMKRGTPLVVAINVSAKQLIDNNFSKIVEMVLNETGLPSYLLEIELTESLLIEDIETSIHTFQQLSSLGVNLAIDDFGTGFSSLSYLTQLPVKKLKIDRAFLKNIFSKKADRKLINGIVALGHSLGLNIVAEGIETLAQLGFLRDIGCDLAQGYLLNRPLKADDLVIQPYNFQYKSSGTELTKIENRIHMHIKLTDNFNIGQVADLKEEMGSSLTNEEVVSIDASEVETADAAAMQLMAAFFLHMLDKGIDVEINAPSSAFLTVVRLTGLGPTLGLL